jgi:hypothetical protein
LRNQARVLECRRVDRNLVSTLVQNILGGGDIANAAGNTKRDVDDLRHLRDPEAVNGPSVRTCGNVVKHQLVSTFAAIALSQLDNIADDTMVAKAYTFNDHTIADVETGNYAFC